MAWMRLLLLASICSLTLPAAATDHGQFANVPADIRAWFKSVRSPSGVPCCDVADGHRTTWRAGKNGGYEVQIENEWQPVPPEAIITDANNPVGEAIVWYSKFNGRPYIRCFVPGGGV